MSTPQTARPALLHRLRRMRLLPTLALAAALIAGCAAPGGQPGPRADRADHTADGPRIAVVSAFAPELALLLQQVQQPSRRSIGGVEFTSGTLAGKPVVLFLSGISMTNAAMNTQRALDHFRISHIVFSGIAGGVNPNLNIGDVTVPEQWGQYMESLMARETTPGQYAAPPWMQAELPDLPAFGMMRPRTVEVRSAARPGITRQFWFAADPGMLTIARSLQGLELAQCHAASSQCLTQRPRLVVGGNGVSGPAFVDNKAFREHTFKAFGANVLDMETAATAMVAHSNGVPYIALRSLSDLAGGGAGENEIGIFMNLAADNSARVLLAFLAAWK